jgi:hypothetical protein
LTSRPAAIIALNMDEELRDIEEWRFEELQRAGYDSEAALLLCDRHEVDLHVACELVRSHGATVEQALRILL